MSSETGFLLQHQWPHAMGRNDQARIVRSWRWVPFHRNGSLPHTCNVMLIIEVLTSHDYDHDRVGNINYHFCYLSFIQEIFVKLKWNMDEH